MSTVLLNPIHKQLFQVQHAHPRASITRVLYGRFLRWLDKASWYAVGKAIGSFLLFITGVLTIVAHSFVLGVLSRAIVEPTIVATVAFILIFFHWRLAFRSVKRLRLRRGNQHTIAGVPVSELADFLIEHGSFTLEAAGKAFAIPQRQWVKAANLLEQHGILSRGEKNARVLQDITRENLVRQLRALASGEAPPLVYDEDRKQWVERDGVFARWCMAEDFKRSKIEEKIERRERKVERLDEQIEERKAEAQRLHPLFASLETA
jgi:hypothetical protein